MSWESPAGGLSTAAACPTRLSWGRTVSGRKAPAGTGASRPGTSQSTQQPQQQHEPYSLLVLDNAESLHPEACNQAVLLQQPLEHACVNWQQPTCSVMAMLSERSSRTSAGHQTVDALICSESAEAQVRRAVLRSVLAALLQEEEGPLLDHYQLTVQAVAAVALHKASEAASKAREEGMGAAAAAAKQQVQAAQHEAEQKACKQVAEANTRAAAAAAAHSQELANLQAQLATLQAEKRQLYGKSAQQSRNARQATAAAEELQGQLEELRQQVQRQAKQLEAKDAALSRSKAAHSQEVSALKSALQQTTADAEAASVQHAQQLQHAKQQHSAQLAGLKTNLQTEAQLQLHSLYAAHEQQLQDQEQQMTALVASTLKQLNLEMQSVQELQRQKLHVVAEDVAQALQESASVSREAWLQLHFMREELTGIQMLVQQTLAVAASQQSALQQLHQQLTDVAPEGLVALQEQAETARQEHAAALQQLQESSMQLASMQPQLVKLQQDKQALHQQLAAAEATQHSLRQEVQALQQQLQHQSEQHGAALQQLQTKLNEQQQLLGAAQASGQEAATERAAAATALADMQEQHTQQLLEERLQLNRISSLYEQHGQQIQERLQWICTAYISQEVDAEKHQQASLQDTCQQVTAAALLKLQHLCGIGGKSSSHAGSPDELLQKYQLYQQHKASLAQQQQLRRQLVSKRADLSPSKAQHVTCCADDTLLMDANQGAEAASAGTVCTIEHDASMQAVQCLEPVQQLLLQLEAGLLQHMLSLREATQALTEQQQQALASMASTTQRPETASSRCTDNGSLTTSSGSSRKICDLTGQLLQAMAKDKKQLSQELKKLQSQQVQQRRSMRNSVSLEPSAAVDMLSILHSPCQPQLSQQWACEDVDEVLQLLQCCQIERGSKSVARSNSGARRLQPASLAGVVGTVPDPQPPTGPLKSSSSTAMPAKHMYTRGIGSLRVRTSTWS